MEQEGVSDTPRRGKEIFPGFGLDVTGDGFLYYIEGAKGLETPVDTPVYEAWFKRYFGGAKPVEVKWVTRLSTKAKYEKYRMRSGFSGAESSAA